MRGRILGIFLILHGLAHAGPGMLAASAGGARLGLPDAPEIGVATLLWGAAMVEFTAAGVGLLGVRALARCWRVLVLVAAIASTLLLTLWRPAMMVPGVLIDLLLVGLALGWRTPDAWLASAARPASSATRRRLGRVGHMAVLAFLGYLVLIVLTRPCHMRWGVTDAELTAPLPGDEIAPDPRYQIMHAVTIHAPADAVWPWLAQIGQDRAGFYSYDWLERLIGDDVHNLDSIVPAWTHRRAGDLVRATQPGYLGGLAGSDPGWRIARVEPGRVMVLQGWGAFVLVPMDGGATRLIVRSRSNAPPHFLIAPLAALVLEPGHFIMERGMLLGIKQRAERAARPTLVEQR